MSPRPWYKHYPSDFLAGIGGMQADEIAAYTVCLNLIYDRGGPIRDDARRIAGLCGMSVRRWNVVRENLIRMGKLVRRDDFLSNPRAEKELGKGKRSADNPEKKSEKMKDNPEIMSGSSADHPGIKSRSSGDNPSILSGNINDFNGSSPKTGIKNGAELDGVSRAGAHTRVARAGVPEARDQSPEGRVSTDPEVATHPESESTDTRARAPDASGGRTILNSIPKPNGDKEPIVFEQGVIRLNQRNLDLWIAAYPHIDVLAELINLTEWAGKKKNWFFAVPGALRKKNTAARMEIERIRAEAAAKGAPEDDPEQYLPDWMCNGGHEKPDWMG